MKIFRKVPNEDMESAASVKKDVTGIGPDILDDVFIVNGPGQPAAAG